MGEERLLLQQHRIIQEAKFIFWLVGKELAKQAKIIEEQEEKQKRNLRAGENNPMKLMNLITL